MKEPHEKGIAIQFGPGLGEESQKAPATFFPKRAQERTRKAFDASPPAGLMPVGR
jgi:hypothetical protein